MEEKKWHSLALVALCRELGSSESGLGEAEAARRLSEQGPNEIAEIRKDPWYVRFLLQFKSLPIMMLLAAAAISFALGFTVDSGKLIDACAISVAVALAVTFGFWQEYKAERVLEALKSMVVQRSVVVRGGRDMSIDSRELVAGDIVILEEGSRVPADIRLIEATNLAIDQSMLTGESRPAGKAVAALPDKTVIADQGNMAFAGTIIVRGHCTGMVVSTGMKTEFGKIVGFVTEEKDSQTPLEKSISGLSKALGIGGILFAALFFFIGIMRGEAAVGMLVVAITLAVAVIPEGLPTVLAITLALGVQKMVKRNAIVRKMPSVETLGSATVICTDKTGTITQNCMAVQELILASEAYSIGQGRLDRSAASRDAALERAMEIMALCNNAMFVKEGGKDTAVGDPTEIALLHAIGACGGDEKELRLAHRLEAEIPFDSGRKMMTCVRSYRSGRMALVKGAPDRLLARCSKVLLPEGEKALTQKWRQKFSSDVDSLGQQGMRVLALAYRPVGNLQSYTTENTEKDLVLVGLAGMEDPPRPEVPEAIALCKSAGIRVVMVTGDSPTTAKAIAAKVGLLSKGQRIVDGPELEAMDDAELGRMLYSVAVFSRVAPEDKYRIVDAFLRKGDVVAATGDGVNDAPAIKKANIGIAMGIAGTDVSKEVADIVLTDDNFASIVNAVQQGRAIFGNIKSFVRYQISTNIAALSLMFAAPALGMPLPLIPIQILWINIMVDGPPAVALGSEPSCGEEMKVPPRDPKEKFLTRNLVAAIAFNGLLMGAISLAAFGYYLSAAPDKAFTAVFTLFVFLQLANALNCRSARESLLTHLFSNRWLMLAIAGSLAVHIAIIYYGPLQEVFKTVPLGPADFAIIGAAALLMLSIEELRKRLLPASTAY
ncbi:Potassium-transporting ATPase ATP-binding subunit [uncultured archaeon]|nr:Potassium-transporting ATPase ATP-binding subunit [uncultured archaeon]